MQEYEIKLQPNKRGNHVIKEDERENINSELTSKPLSR